MKNEIIAIYAREFIVINAIITILLRRYSYNVKKKDDRKRYIYSFFFLIAGYVIYIMFTVFRTIKIGVGGVDSIAYKTIFLSAYNRRYLDFLLSTKEEFGFKTIIWIIRLFTDDYRYVLLLFHTIAYIGMCYFIKNINNDRETLLVYIFTFLNCSYLLYMINILRSGLVVILCADVIILLLKKDYIKAIFLLFFCITIHISAVILIPVVVWLLIKKYCKHADINRFIVLVIIMEEIALILLKRIIGSSAYYIYTNSEGISLRTYIIALLIILIISWQKKENTNIESENDILKFIFICIPIQMQYSIAYRMTIIFSPLLYLCMYKLFENNKIFKGLRFKAKSILAWSFVLFYFLYKCYSIFYIEFVNVYPYTNDIFGFFNVGK